MKLLSEIRNLWARVRENTLSAGAGVVLEKSPSGTRISVKPQELPGDGAKEEGPKGQWDVRLVQDEDTGLWYAETFDSFDATSSSGDLLISEWVKVPYARTLVPSSDNLQYLCLVVRFDSNEGYTVSQEFISPLDQVRWALPDWRYPLAEFAQKSGSASIIGRLHTPGKPMKVLGRWV